MHIKIILALISGLNFLYFGLKEGMTHIEIAQLTIGALIALLVGYLGKDSTFKIPGAKNINTGLIVLLSSCLFLIPGCSITKEVMDSVKPTTDKVRPSNAEEGVVYAMGALRAIESAVVFVFSNPANLATTTDKAIAGLIAEKLAANKLKAVDSALLLMRSGHTRAEAIASLGPSPLLDFAPAMQAERFAKVMEKLKKGADAIEAVNQVSGLASMDLTQCKLKIDGIQEPLPCDVPTDYVLMVLLQLRQAGQ